MSTIEELLARDIEAVTADVVVTESDLREARAAVDERVRSRSRRDLRTRVVVVAAAAAVVVGVAGWQVLWSDDGSPTPARPVPSPTPSEVVDPEQPFLSGDPPTQEQMAGVWRLDNPTTSRMLYQFTADGQVRYDDKGRLSEDPLVTGTYDISGKRITVEVDGGQAQCAGRTLVWRAVVNSAGGLNVLPTDEGADGCGRPYQVQWVLEQMLPQPDDGASFDVPRGDDWPPPTSRGALVGIWWAVGEEYLVELRQEGSYSVLAGKGEVVDRGTWAVDGAVTQVTLTSTADSATCREGDRFVLRSLRSADLGAWNLRGSVARDDCAGGWALNKWVKLA
jgi:hypothetical protein